MSELALLIGVVATMALMALMARASGSEADDQRGWWGRLRELLRALWLSGSGGTLGFDAQAALRRFAAGLEQGRHCREGLLEQDHLVEGRWRGRELRLRYEGERLLVYQLRVPGRSDSFQLDIREVLARADGLADDPARGQQARDVEDALGHLARASFDRVELRGGWLTISRPSFEYALGARSLERAFTALQLLVPLFARTSLTVRVGPTREAEATRFAWSDGGGQLLCPYCRDGLDPAGAAACPLCATLHHDECLAEAGRCTVFGCGGRIEPGERAPADRAG